MQESLLQFLSERNVSKQRRLYSACPEPSGRLFQEFSFSPELHLIKSLEHGGWGGAKPFSLSGPLIRCSRKRAEGRGRPERGVGASSAPLDNPVSPHPPSGSWTVLGRKQFRRPLASRTCTGFSASRAPHPCILSLGREARRVGLRTDMLEKPKRETSRRFRKATEGRRHLCGSRRVRLQHPGSLRGVLPLPASTFPPKPTHWCRRHSPEGAGFRP